MIFAVPVRFAVTTPLSSTLAMELDEEENLNRWLAVEGTGAAVIVAVSPFAIHVEDALRLIEVGAGLFTTVTRTAAEMLVLYLEVTVMTAVPSLRPVIVPFESTRAIEELLVV